LVFYRLVSGGHATGKRLGGDGPTWWGEAPERLYAFDEAASKLNPACGYTKTLADLSDEAFQTVTQCPFFQA